MSRSDNLIRALVVGGLVVALSGWGWMTHAGYDQVAILSIVGSVASLVGLPIVLVQLQSVRRVSESTQAAVRETQSRLEHTVSAGDVARAIKMVEQVQWYASQRQYDLARLRLSDVRGLLVQLSETERLIPMESEARFTQLLIAVGIDLQSLFGLAQSNKKQFDANTMNGTLDELAGMLARLEHHIRFPRVQ